MIASREDIDASSSWNHAIRSKLLPAFLDAVKYFNNCHLRYTWIRYLPTREPIASFLKPFHVQLRETLPWYEILQSQHGDLVPAKRLTYIPEKYIFNGLPITISSSSSSSYLSENYSKSDLKCLKALGVVEMSEYSFFAALQLMINATLAEFKAKPDAWHAHLAEILIRSAQTYHDTLLDMPLVPLENGSWVSARDKQILFPTTKAEFDLPTGLELLVVDAKAAKDFKRRKLFTTLGIGDFSQEPIMRHIEELHVTDRASSDSMPRSALVSQIQFLYSTGWKNPQFEKFWFYAESGQRFRGSQLYQDSKEPLSASFFFGKHRNKFRFVHKDYMKASKSAVMRDSWSEWLEEKMDVARIPRLVQASDQGFKLSEDFEWITKNFPSSDVLLLLREHWEEYRQFFDLDQAKKRIAMLKEKFDTDAGSIISCVTKVNQRLRSMLVMCRNGKKCRLDATFLPSRELLMASQDGVPFFEIPDPNNMRWQAFQTFGVSIKVDVSVYLRCLQKLAGEKSRDTLQVAGLYDTLQLRSSNPTEADTIL